MTHLSQLRASLAELARCRIFFFFSRNTLNLRRRFSLQLRTYTLPSIKIAKVIGGCVLRGCLWVNLRTFPHFVIDYHRNHSRLCCHCSCVVTKGIAREHIFVLQSDGSFVHRGSKYCCLYEFKSTPWMLPSKSVLTLFGVFQALRRLS